MNNRIKILSEETINKIAAGEVVERPASIVKELIENSLDAGANKVEVNVKSAGKNMIRIVDNGSGMDKADAQLSLERYATSKIASIRDIENISTLGFRGEALPSIAAVSRLTIITCVSKSDIATRLHSEGGELLEVKETGAPQGTMVEVRNLFFNIPARRKFLRTNTTELNNIISIFSNYVLTSKNCGFKLTSDDKVLLEVFAKDSIVDRIRVLYGNDVAESLLPVRAEKNGMKVSGYISNPSYTRSNRSLQLAFINNRPIVSRSISYAVYEAYGSLVPKGRFPVAFLFIDVPAGSIDVNVHPSKREVRFRSERLVQNMVRESIYQSFQGIQSSTLDCASKARGSLSTREITKMAPLAFREEKVVKGKADCQVQGNSLWQANEANLKEWLSPDKGVGEALPGTSYNLAQMNNSYIICENKEGFDIIDQHAVHERLLYEKIKKDLAAHKPESQRLLIPVTFELSVAEEQLLSQYIDLLGDLGFVVEEFGSRTVKIEMIPAYLDKVDIISLIKDMLGELKEVGKAVAQDNVRERIIKIMSCRAAVKQGDSLDRLEMQRLIKEWQKLTHNYTCPHGRPAVIKMKRKDLDKQFRRS